MSESSQVNSTAQHCSMRARQVVDRAQAPVGVDLAGDVAHGGAVGAARLLLAVPVHPLRARHAHAQPACGMMGHHSEDL